VITMACSSPPGSGEVGRHFAELLDDLRWQGSLARYYSSALDVTPGQPTVEGEGRLIGTRTAERLRRWTALRFGAGRRSFARCDAFDRGVAARLLPADEHVGFPGESRSTFLRARRLGFESLQLVTVTGHVDNVSRLQAEAHRRWPLEGGRLSEPHRRKIGEEYELADVILVSSEYSWRSFVAAGAPEPKLGMWQPRPDPRYQPAARKPQDGVFRIVFVGSISVANGACVLIEALASLKRRDLELRLIGECGSPAMRRHLQSAMARDPRIRLCAGDPLPHVRRADVLVHPSFEGGFGYAPIDALACGVPVIVNEDTGMKEHVDPGRNGWVVPTGSVEAVVDRLEALMARPLAPAADVSHRQFEFG
jgi:glycosyltransferase involved in cell wall biosynthesis